MRTEIQALRAVAVGLVVVYHVWPSAASGGFVGVDVFFAISGYLITSLLLREIDRKGEISLRHFWARRARRILPAALLTLLLCALATVAFVPLSAWPQYFADMRASTGYVQNWHLAANAVDYFAADNAPSPVQHYWSLSVEEQFYLGWPVMMVCAMVAVRGRSRRVKRAAVATAMAALTVWSLRYSLLATTSEPGAAYFITSTRAWEFGAGGLLAIAGRTRSEGRAAALLSWAGLGAIAAAGLLYTDTTPFPGWAALLPIVGTLAVIWAGAPSPRWSPRRLLKLPPVQFLGDVSYAVYLWHWPLIVLAPFVIPNAVHSALYPVGIVMLTLLLSWLSKVFVEDPLRSGPLLVKRPMKWTFISAVAATAVVMAVNVGGTGYVQARIRHDEQVTAHVLAHRPRCFGAASRDPQHPCANPALRVTVVPTPVQAESMRNLPCQSKQHDGVVSICSFGSKASEPAGTVALIGDSHASHWRAALDPVTRTRRWRGLSITHTACPFSAATPDIPEPGRSDCLRWKRAVPQWLRRHPEVKTVFVSNHTGGGLVGLGNRDPFWAKVDGYTAMFRSLPATVQHIVVIRDTPKMRSETRRCIERALAAKRPSGNACAEPRGHALERDPAIVAARRLADGRGQSIDMTPFLCTARRCQPVIGGVLVYKDIHHLTTVYADTLAPYLDRSLAALMTRWHDQQP